MFVKQWRIEKSWKLESYSEKRHGFFVGRKQEKLRKNAKALPLAIITVAGELKFESKPSWEDAIVQLQSTTPVDISGVTQNLYQPLKLSYDHLESDEIRFHAKNYVKMHDVIRHMAISIAAEGKLLTNDTITSQLLCGNLIGLSY